MVVRILINSGTDGVVKNPKTLENVISGDFFNIPGVFISLAAPLTLHLFLDNRSQNNSMCLINENTGLHCISQCRYRPYIHDAF